MFAARSIGHLDHVQPARECVRQRRSERLGATSRASPASRGRAPGAHRSSPCGTANSGSNTGAAPRAPPAGTRRCRRRRRCSRRSSGPLPCSWPASRPETSCSSARSPHQSTVGDRERRAAPSADGHEPVDAVHAAVRQQPERRRRAGRRTRRGRGSPCCCADVERRAAGSAAHSARASCGVRKRASASSAALSGRARRAVGIAATASATPAPRSTGDPADARTRARELARRCTRHVSGCTMLRIAESGGRIHQPDVGRRVARDPLVDGLAGGGAAEAHDELGPQRRRRVRMAQQRGRAWKSAIRECVARSQPGGWIGDHRPARAPPRATRRVGQRRIPGVRPEHQHAPRCAPQRAHDRAVRGRALRAVGGASRPTPETRAAIHRRSGAGTSGSRNGRLRCTGPGAGTHRLGTPRDARARAHSRRRRLRTGTAPPRSSAQSPQRASAVPSSAPRPRRAARADDRRSARPAARAHGWPPPPPAGNSRPPCPRCRPAPPAGRWPWRGPGRGTPRCARRVHAVRQARTAGDRERERRGTRTGADDTAATTPAACSSSTSRRARTRGSRRPASPAALAMVHQGAPQSSGPSTVRSLSSVSVNSARGWERATMPAPAHAVARSAAHQGRAQGYRKLAVAVRLQESHRAGEPAALDGLVVGEPAQRRVDRRTADRRRRMQALGEFEQRHRRLAPAARPQVACTGAARCGS